MILEEDNAILIYARLGSSRLPQKALRTIGHYKLIELIIERLKDLGVKLNAKIVLATTDNPLDDKLVAFAQKNGINVFRGDENDVMKRTMDFIKSTNVVNICRVNGDCPFVDSNLLISGFHKLKEGYDFVTNIHPRTFPYGVAVEWFTTKLYRKFYSKALSHEKEHVTKHLYRYLNEIKYYNIKDDDDNSKLTLTIDTLDDYNMVSKYFTNMSAKDQINLSYKKILNL